MNGISYYSLLYYIVLVKSTTNKNISYRLSVVVSGRIPNSPKETAPPNIPDAPPSPIAATKASGAAQMGRCPVWAAQIPTASIASR